jgi:hypothetical protein
LQELGGLWANVAANSGFELSRWRCRVLCDRSGVGDNRQQYINDIRCA